MANAPVSTWSNTRLDPYMDPEDAHENAIQLVASQTYVAGQVLGEVTASPGTYGKYASGNSDGTQVPKLLLREACVTDSSGNITGADNLGDTRKDTHAFFSGTFKCSDLTGLDAAGLTASGWRLISGATVGAANAIVRLG